MNMQKYLQYVVKSFRYIFKKAIAGSYDGYIFSFCEKVPEWLSLFVLPCTVNKGSSSPSSLPALTVVCSHAGVC